MMRVLFATVGLAVALLCAVASAATAAPYDGPAKRQCARTYDGTRCMPNLGSLNLRTEGRPAYVRAMAPDATAYMPRRFTDLHAYNARGRALVQLWNRRADAYVFRSPRTGRVVAAFDLTNRTWYALSRVIVVGWQS